MTHPTTPCAALCQSLPRSERVRQGEGATPPASSPDPFKLLTAAIAAALLAGVGVNVGRYLLAVHPL